MADIIHLLPDSVANQIAAGEVIQRPASVIKELVENAVDAGATDIRIVIRDAGKTLIQVSDNGIGMSETDVRMAFERHATSKIKSTDDLFTLSSMGFRGEALPSICAISEVEVRTRPKDSAIGTRIIIEGSKVSVQEPCACDVGTVISVRKIFFNVPARRKFLKSDAVELSNIMREFERLALVNNCMRMSIDTGTKSISLRPASMRIRIEDIWKNSLKADHLVPVNVDTSLIKVEGFVTRPEFARRRNPLQYLIVNGRNMRHPYFHKAIVSCFDSLIATDTMPCYFMKFEVDPSTIDVNIHPTKNEIKFEYEQQIWPILVSAVKTALGRYSAVPSIDFDSDAIELNPLLDSDHVAPPSINYNPNYNPFNDEREHSGGVTQNWEKLYENFHSNLDAESDTSVHSNLFNDNTTVAEIEPICMQWGLKYIITTTREGVIIIDQHRAHVKILYQQYLDKARSAEIVSQSVMFPELLSLDDAQNVCLRSMLPMLCKIGFNFKEEDENRWQIVSVPSILKPTDACDVVLRVLDSEANDSLNYGKEGDVGVSLTERVAHIMAKSAAIRRGQRLSQSEMESIIGALFSLPDPSLTPTGNQVYVVLDNKKIASLF